MHDILIERKTVPVTYDKTILSLLRDNANLTELFINGLFGHDNPVNANVWWLNERSYVEEAGIFTEFFPQIDDNLYHVEVRHDENDDVQLIATFLNEATTDENGLVIFDILFPCIVYMKGSANKPTTIQMTWRAPDYSKTLPYHPMRLVDMSVEELALRNLLPVALFYLSIFEPLTDDKVPEFKAAAALLLEKLHEAVSDGKIPNCTGLQLEQGIRAIGENTIRKSRLEGNLSVDPSILETLPWTDYRSVMEQERSEGLAEGKAEGKTEGKAERDREIALNAFATVGRDGNTVAKISQTLKNWGIPYDVVIDARNQAERDGYFSGN